MIWFYSFAQKGFFNPAEWSAHFDRVDNGEGGEWCPRADGMLADAVAVSTEQKAALHMAESSGQRIIRGPDGRPSTVPPPPPSAEYLRALWRADRQAQVDAITVTVDNMVFDGDEVSQGRMARALLVLEDGETTLWVLANNTPTQVARAQLQEALRLAGVRQTELWVPPAA